MAKLYPVLIIGGILIIAGWLVWGSVHPDARPALGSATTTGVTHTEAISAGGEAVTHECNADGRQCADGSVVGRTGPLCEFAACPKTGAQSGTIRTYIGGAQSALNVTITPRQVVDDSRCPTDVQCIWAGTAHVRASINTSAEMRDETFELGKPLRLGAYTITLSELTPAKSAGDEIPASSYRFVFTVSRS
jgi:hypothetical protein